jgi:hypothetical protein
MSDCRKGIALFVMLLCNLTLYAQQDYEKPSSYSDRFFTNVSLKYQQSREGWIERNGDRTRFFPKENNLEGRFAFSISGSHNFFVIKETLALGLGIGYFKYYRPDLAYIPVLFDIKYHIFQGDKSLYFGLQYGQAIFNTNYLNRGYHIELLAGFLFKVFNAEVFSIELGYRGLNSSFSNESFRNSDSSANVTGFSFGINYFFLE